MRHERGLPLLEELEGIRPGFTDDVQGHPLADIRIYVEGSEGEEIPTKKGISVKVEQLPQLLEAVQALVGAAA